MKTRYFIKFHDCVNTQQSKGKVLWVKIQEDKLPPQPRFERSKIFWEDISIKLRDALQNSGDPDTIISQVYPVFNPSQEIARLCQVVDANNFSVRYLDIWEVIS